MFTVDVELTDGTKRSPQFLTQREAVAYAGRMAQDGAVKLSAVRGLGQDDWSPEAREAAAKARAGSGGGGSGEEHKFHLSASHPTGGGKKFQAKANSHEEVEKHIGNVRKSYPEHNVTVHNKPAGIAHTFKPHENYNKNYVE